MDFSDRSDNAIPDHFPEPPCSFTCLALVSHLGCHLILFCCFCQHSCFMNGVGKWCLSENMCATFHCLQTNHRMGVIRCGNDHSINVFLTIQHDPKVFVLLRTRVSFKDFCRCLSPIDITQRNDVFSFCNIGQITSAHSRNAHTGDVQFLSLIHISEPTRLG